MKCLFALALLMVGVVVSAAEPSDSLLEVGAAPLIIPGSAGYVPQGLVDANPATKTDIVPLIPGASTNCQITPQTIQEVMAIRADSAKLAIGIQTESQNCDARRRYIEHLTNFLNIWITELNRLKRDLNSCDKFIALSENRIKQLELKEKLIKIEDITNCINVDKQGDEAWKKLADSQKTSLDAAAGDINKQLDAIKQSISDLIADKPPAAAAAAPAS